MHGLPPMMTILVPLAVCLVGAVVHLLSSGSAAPGRARFATLGAYAFAVGLWWTLGEAAHHVIHIG